MKAFKAEAFIYHFALRKECEWCGEWYSNRLRHCTNEDCNHINVDYRTPVNKIIKIHDKRTTKNIDEGALCHIR